MYLQTEVDALMDETKRKIEAHTKSASRDLASIADALSNAELLHSTRIKSLNAQRDEADAELSAAILEAFEQLLTIRKGMTGAPKPEPQPKQEPEGESNVVQIAAAE